MCYILLPIAAALLLAACCRQHEAQLQDRPRTEEAAAMTEKNTKTDAEWRAELTEQQYRVLRQCGTERAFSGAYWNAKTGAVNSSLATSPAMAPSRK